MPMERELSRVRGQRFTFDELAMDRELAESRRRAAHYRRQQERLQAEAIAEDISNYY